MADEPDAPEQAAAGRPPGRAVFAGEYRCTKVVWSDPDSYAPFATLELADGSGPYLRIQPGFGFEKGKTYRLTAEEVPGG